MPSAPCFGAASWPQRDPAGDFRQREGRLFREGAAPSAGMFCHPERMRAMVRILKAEAKRLVELT